MFNIFKKKCPMCRMELEKNKEYPEGYGKKFCSEHCREEYKTEMGKEQSKSSHKGCCR